MLTVRELTRNLTDVQQAIPGFALLTQVNIAVIYFLISWEEPVSRLLWFVEP